MHNSTWSAHRSASLEAEQTKVQTSYLSLVPTKPTMPVSRLIFTMPLESHTWVARHTRYQGQRPSLVRLDKKEVVVRHLRRRSQRQYPKHRLQEQRCMRSAAVKHGLDQQLAPKERARRVVSITRNAFHNKPLRSVSRVHSRALFGW